MANSVNIFLCFLFYSCLITVTNFQFKVSSEEISNGVGITLQNTDDKVRNDKLDFVHIQTGNYKMKSVVLQEKTCEGKDCTTKASGKPEHKIRGRHRRKRKRNGHAQRQDSKIPTATLYSTTKTPLKSHRPRHRHSESSSTQVHPRKDGTKRANGNRKNGRRNGKVQKQGRETETSKTDLKLPQRETEIKIELPKIHGFRFITNRRPRVKVASQGKEKSQSIIQPRKGLDRSRSDDAKNKNVQAPEIERKSNRKQIDSEIPNTHNVQRQKKRKEDSEKVNKKGNSGNHLQRERSNRKQTDSEIPNTHNVQRQIKRKEDSEKVNKKGNSGNHLQRERSRIESIDDTNSSKIKNEKQQNKFQSRNSKKNDQHKQSSHITSKHEEKKAETNQRQLHRSPSNVASSPRKGDRNEKLPGVSHGALQLSPPNGGRNVKLPRLSHDSLQLSAPKGGRNEKLHRLSHDSLQLSQPSGGRNEKLPRLSHDSLQLSPPSGMHDGKLSSNTGTHQSDRRYPYHRQPHHQRAPAGVGRLEQRLHPSLWTSLSSLKHNMETVLFKLREKINRVNHDHDMLYNKTRYEVMSKVREQLQHIAEENDHTYDVVLDVSQLIRYIYLRAHNHGLMSPAPRELREHSRIAELNVKDFSPDYRRTDSILHQTRNTFRKVMEAKRTCMRQESKTKDMIHKVKHRVPKRELDDMDRILRRLLAKQNSDMRIGYAKLRLRRYENRYRRMKKHVENARNFTQISFSDMREAQKHFLQNKEYQRMIKEAKANNRRQKRATHISRAELKRLSTRAYRHARNLQKVTETIEKTLVPLVAKATNFTGGNTQSLAKTQIRVILGRVRNLIKKYERKFDEIRILLGNDDILKERCEYLFELGGFNDELTPIDCEDFGIYSGSGDLPVSTKPPSTTLLKTSTPAPISTTLHSEDKIEGSATSDFEFVESEDEKKEKAAEESSLWYKIWSDDPLAGNRDLFREKLQELALANRTKSEQIYARVEKIETRSQASSEKWNRLMAGLNFNAKYVDLATLVSHSWADAKPYIEGIKQTIVTAHEKITKQVEKIKVKLPAILQKANETLSKLQQNNTGDKSRESIGVSVIQDLITAVDKSKSNMASIKNVRVAQTPPCKKVETFATQLRTNIAELRKKIERARDITASMKLTVAMAGDGYMSVPLQAKKDLLPTTSFEMCIKPSGTDMNVAQFHDNKTSVYSVHIKDSLPIVTVYDNKGEKYGDVEGPSSFNDDQWYSIRIERFGHTVKLSTRDMSESLDTEATMANAFPDLTPFQNSPVAAYIGGLPTDTTDDGNSQFNGCIGDVMVDGRNVGLHSHSGKTNMCSDRCSNSPDAAMVFEGNGYVKFPLRLISAPYDIDNIQLNFTTRQKNGIIFLLNHRTQMFQVLISLTEGSLHVEARTKRGTTVLRSGLDTYANGKTHHILITFGTDKIDVMTDNGTDKFTAETRTQEITSRLDSGIYLGGLGSTSQPLSGKAKLRSLVGCISHLKINEKEIPMFMMEESKNAHLGSCTNNILTQCVWFDSNSSPITLDETEEASRIYAVVNSESRGTVLQYRRGKYFNIEISVTADGINVYDVKEEESKIMQCSFQHWYILEVLDQNKKVHISCHSEKVTISYSCGGWFGNCDKKTYMLTIGGTDAEGTPLTGGISQLLVNDKSIPLSQYMDDHNLTTCHHQPSEPLENQIIEKPICVANENTVVHKKDK